MQLSILETLADNASAYHNKRIMISLSGGINSAAVACYAGEYLREEIGEEIWAFYVHFEEHSPGTQDFVDDIVSYLKTKFKKVHFKQITQSVLKYFKESKMIPHPSLSPCTAVLKRFPIQEFKVKNKIDYDLIGYIRTEKKRIQNQKRRGGHLDKMYPISHLDDEDCFSLVKRIIGWYPDIYKIKWTDERILPFLKCHRVYMGEKAFNIAKKYAIRGYNHAKSIRVFAHNNCLPCKNVQTWEYYMVKLFFPEFFKKAMQTANSLEQHWGREADKLTEAGQNASCGFCKLD